MKVIYASGKGSKDGEDEKLQSGKVRPYSWEENFCIRNWTISVMIMSLFIAKWLIHRYAGSDLQWLLILPSK